ncbi:uncharacterized protein LOC117610889 [Osmia lignaria lignaria]|uniref:uncharacterized protein LOC117610889 n=1 Tax=Osmia lignaria lignaria TaxID=1437193 RepID=UPI0014794EA0|nr:uncharacterized protein LOC117610889 [Osmia lignaria]
MLEGRTEIATVGDSAAGNAALIVTATAGPSSSRCNDSGKCQSCIEKVRYLETIIKQNHLIYGLLMDLTPDMQQLKLAQKVVPVAEQSVSLYTKYEGLQFSLTREEDVLQLETFLAKFRNYQKQGMGTNNYQFVKRVLS